jgi:hypothetical protein
MNQDLAHRCNENIKREREREKNAMWKSCYHMDKDKGIQNTWS